MRNIRFAVLTASATGTPVRAPRWPQRRTFRELIHLGRKLGVEVFVVSHRDFDWNRRLVYGYTLQPVGTREVWVRRRYPLPDIVYNRVPSRTAENSPGVRHCLRRLQRMLGPRCFNPFYLNKAVISRILARHPHLNAYLPPTRPVRSWADVEAMVGRYRHVYLKPAGGSLGNYTAAIFTAPPASRGPRYRYRYNLHRGRTYGGSAWTLEGVRRALQPLLATRFYVVQKAVDLATWQGRRYDVRTLVQKDEDGRWVFTGAAARIAGPGQITTHVPRGGRRAPLDQVLSAFPSDVATSVEAALQTISTAIAAEVERALGRNFGEMSMDIGVDREGKLWLFEANAKPLRFDEPLIRARAQERLLRYARALALGQTRSNVEDRSEMYEAVGV